MIEEGETPSPFELPAVHRDEFELVSLDEHLGEAVVILAFYPGDFSPACDGSSTGLGDLDIFTMQKDVTVLALSGDSIFSHRAFAEEYDLHIPLLADVHGEVAAEYGVSAETDRYLTRRAVVVIDHTKTVQYVWAATDPTELPDTDEIRKAVENLGSDETAEARYRVGHAHYVEGRRAFTSAMEAYENNEWMLSSGDFEQAREGFDEARDKFNTAVRFSDNAEETEYFERAERKSEALWRAADWLDDSAQAFASGMGKQAKALQQDAEGSLETARDIHEPPAPDNLPPEEELHTNSTDNSSLSTDEAAVDNSLNLGDGAVTESGGTDDASETAQVADDGIATGDSTSTAETSQQAAGTPEPDTTEETTDDEQSEDESIDESELEAITAELEEQNDGQSDEPDEPLDESLDSGETKTENDDEADVDDDVELELTDPTEGETDESDDDDDDDTEPELTKDISDGDHGVPDSL